MPERGFDTAFWNDSFVLKLPLEAKVLFAYLWTNAHCNPAGLYEIAPETIAFETALPLGDLPHIFTLIKEKVVWYQEYNLVWVKNFIKRQSKSSKFLAAAAKCLLTIHHNGAISELLTYNQEKYGISIPYQYYRDRLSILTRASASASDTVSVADKEDRVVKGKGELSEEGKAILACLRQLKGWQADDDDVLWLQGLAAEYSAIGIPGPTFADLKACIDYHSGRPPAKHKGVWKNRFRNWMVKKQEFERRDRGGKQPKQKRVRPVTYIPGSGKLGPEGEEDMP